MTKISYGIIVDRYSFAIDGEYCSGTREYDVKVTDYWSKTNKDFSNSPKEVVSENNVYYRQTKLNGWRKYNKDIKKFEEYYIGGYSFIPNKNANSENNCSKIRFGN